MLQHEVETAMHDGTWNFDRALVYYESSGGLVPSVRGKLELSLQCEQPQMSELISVRVK